MTTQEPSNRPIVEIVKPRAESGLLGKMRRRWNSLTGRAGREDLFIVKQAVDGGAQVSKFNPETEAPPKKCTVARVNLDEQTFAPVFPAVVTDDENNRWDLILEGKWFIDDSRLFLRRRGLDAASPRVPLSSDAAASWLVRTLRRDVHDSLKKHSIEGLRDRDDLPAKWWQDRVEDWVGDYGLSAKIESARWESEEAARREEDRRRDEEFERMEKERDREREADLRAHVARQQYESEKRRLHQEHQHGAAGKQQEMRLLEERHRMEMLKAQAECEKTTWAHEKAALEHELTMARLRDDIDSVQDVERRQSEGQRRHDVNALRLTQADHVYQELAASSPLLDDLVDEDPRIAHQAAERLTSVEYGVPPEALAALGYAVDCQAFIARLNEQRDMSRHQVVLRMAGLRGRDIGTNRNETMRVDSLPIGSSLSFELTSTLPGYVTIVNIGTSGKVWLQVPNPFVSPEAARIGANQPTTVPGPVLLPDEAIGDYFEMGPGGWEHMAVTITDVPLVDPRFLALATPEAPFIDLTSDAASELAAALEEQAPDQYAIGMLSFLVE